MARADLLVNLVKAGVAGERELFLRTTEAVIAEERGKQHHVLANSLAAELPAQSPGHRMNRLQLSEEQPFVRESVAERTLSELILKPSVRQTIQEMVEEQQRADLLRSYNLEPRHRILLTGPPGNGKTSLAEAIAESLVVPLFSVRYDALIGSFLGETALRMRQLFDYVRTRKCVLFFDEFDTVAKERGDTHETGEIKRVVSSLLLEIDHLPSYVVVVTATNHPELLDRAVWRRFQAKLELPKPSLKEIEQWLRAFEARLNGQILSTGQALARQLVGTNFSGLEDMAQHVFRRKVLSRPDEEFRVTGDLIRLWAQAAHGERHSIDGDPASAGFSNPRSGGARNSRTSDRSDPISSGRETRRKDRTPPSRTGTDVPRGKRKSGTRSRGGRTRAHPRP